MDIELLIGSVAGVVGLLFFAEKKGVDFLQKTFRKKVIEAARRRPFVFDAPRSSFRIELNNDK